MDSEPTQHSLTPQARRIAEGLESGDLTVVAGTGFGIVVSALQAALEDALPGLTAGDVDSLLNKHLQNSLFAGGMILVGLGRISSLELATLSALDVFISHVEKPAEDSQKSRAVALDLMALVITQSEIGDVTMEGSREKAIISTFLFTCTHLGMVLTHGSGSGSNFVRGIVAGLK